MNNLIVFTLLLLFFQNAQSQAIETELDELIILNKKEKLIRISKGKKATKFYYNYNFEEHLYLIEDIPYGKIENLTLFYSANYLSYRWDEKGKKQEKKAKEIFKNWCEKADFEITIYTVDNDSLIKATENPILLSLKKHKNIHMGIKIDLSEYEIYGDRFILSIESPNSLHYCKENCPSYGLFLYYHTSKYIEQNIGNQIDENGHEKKSIKEY